MNEKENTFRRLAEEPLLVKSAWCYLGLHKWAMWSSPQKYQGNEVQVRTCANCNKAAVILVDIK